MTETPTDIIVEGTEDPAAKDAIRGALAAYVQRVRGGDVGALPAMLGIVALCTIFWQLSDRFLTAANLANLPSQAGYIAILAMGLVFVLLLGEIDLSAGTAAGVCAATMGLALRDDGDLRNSLGTGVYIVVLLFMLAALFVAYRWRLWIAFAMVAAGVVILVTHIGTNQYLAIYLAVATGVAIGLLIGYLVARVGVPSFVVTLALFLAFQGVILLYIGSGSAISVQSYDVVVKFSNGNLQGWQGWLMLAIFVGGYTLIAGYRSVSRRAQGLAHQPFSLVVAKSVSLLLIGVFAVYFLNKPRIGGVSGVPYIVPIILVLMIFWTIVLHRMRYGRHLYAVGGNTEAARRAGIDVNRTKLAAFAICSGMAGLAGVALASRLGSIPADIGGGNTLLYAVGAAVIGGTSLFGGRGQPRDAVLGTIVIGLIPNGLGLLPNLGSAYDYMVSGLVLLVAASVDALSRKRATVAR